MTGRTALRLLNFLLCGLLAVNAAVARAQAEPGFSLNSGLSGSWYNPETPGQGFFLDVQPDDGVLFAASHVAPV